MPSPPPASQVGLTSIGNSPEYHTTLPTTADGTSRWDVKGWATPEDFIKARWVVVTAKACASHPCALPLQGALLPVGLNTRTLNSERVLECGQAKANALGQAWPPSQVSTTKPTSTTPPPLPSLSRRGTGTGKVYSSMAPPVPVPACGESHRLGLLLACTRLVLGVTGRV